ncbi:SDR family oxidoreductase [Mogibacterium timidum]|uniref:SDR family oxidoreductase n=1 Tax=Mogibacterium timidum TaxID=35519 RepID=UPI0028D23F4E|nr:SDR family oxidoreductase [Mogibacterium timidum]
MSNKKVWLVTGCSKGLGKALVEELIAQGYPVAGTSRSKESLEKSIGAESDIFLPLSMNVKDEADVKNAISLATEKFGRIDVVINNAGFTHLATIEEMSDADAREEFDINVFGTLNVIRNVLPQMRAQGSGHIFNVSSLGAYNVGPLSGIYCATKHAVKAISETLAQEVKAFGIHVTDVKPGFMRTEFFGASYKTTAPDGSPYKNLYDENMEFYMGQNGNQAGDPKKAAQLYIKVAEMDEPYESLPMGTDCCDGIRDICEGTVKLMTEMCSVAETTNF